MLAPPLAAAFSSLPSRSLTEKTLFSDSTETQFIFPKEFPYEFESFSPAFTSPGDSTETEEDETSDDEDDFLAGLTRRLSSQRLSSPPLPLPVVSDKSEVKTESKLSGIASPNGPFPQQDSLKVISAAAGEVAKLTNQNPKPNFVNPFPYQNAASCQYYYFNWLWQPQYFARNASLYPALAAPNAVRPPSTGTSVLAAPNAVKTPSTGTGVFLPRNYTKSGSGSVKSTKKVVESKTEEASKIDPECLVTFPSLKREDV